MVTQPAKATLDGFYWYRAWQVYEQAYNVGLHDHQHVSMLKHCHVHNP